jgi:hypothetical protein
MAHPLLRRFPTSLLLALSLLTFVGSVLLFTIPFEVDNVGANKETADCGPPIFEIAASDYAAPSTIAPPDTTAELPFIARIPSSSTTSSIQTYVFGVPVTTTTLPGQSTTTTIVTTVGTSAPPPSTIPLADVKASCGAPASKRFFLGGIGIVVAAIIGFLARLRRAAKFGYVVR